MLQKRSPGADASGGQPNNWADVLPVWGEIIPGGGKEAELGGGVRAISDYVITIRYLKGISSQHRFKYSDRKAGKDRFFSISNINNFEERNKDMALACTEGTTDD
jgi:SPP1 family predicted phage head-tail adaptor